MLQANPFHEIAAILALAAAAGAVGLILHQPLIITFLFTGILAGPAFLGIIASYEQIELFAHIGIALLLFIVGLRLDLSLIRTIGPVALATGLGQIAFTSLIGYLIAVALGMPPLSAAYVAVALTFSSTIIIVKLLSDKQELDSLHGRIAIGFLIVQDIAAILAMVALTTVARDLVAGESAARTILEIAARGIGLLLGIGILMRFVLPALLERLARNQEMLLLFAVAWAILMGAAGEVLGFSKEVGAFLAGISLASTAYRDAIGARLVGLRDFLLLFFFIDLGSRLEWSTVGSQIGASAIFSMFVLIGNPLIVMAIMGVMGYRRRTGFLAGLTVAQISEFSLILGALGLSLGHITAEIMGLITLVGVVTIFASTYMILYSGPLYRLLSRRLKPFERRIPHRESFDDCPDGASPDSVILVGLGNYGSGLAEHLLERKKNILGVDFDPRVLRDWKARGIAVIYGDMADPELHEQLPLGRARWVVSTVRGPDLNLPILRLLQQRRYAGKVALTARNEQEALLYQKAGAHLVLRPFDDAAEQAADHLTDAAHMLPEMVDWPIGFRDVRLRSGSLFAGCLIRDIPLRPRTGVSILALSRAGRVHFDPRPDVQVFPNDRLLLMGPPDELRVAERLLNERHEQDADIEPGRFSIAEIEVAETSPLAGRTLADAQFRQAYNTTVIGLRRGGEKIVAPGPLETIHAGDRLIVIGLQDTVEGLKRAGTL
ncbi:MAG: cation:proton antiporter [Syntrophales bacterium]|jgi:Kef-type K+ transport system membrane component KefB/Trk K+ transport system NAD-binding subunit|nr:cation:proton antiporter [Syntrophales bacterium]